jgi:hypothetical protein
MTSTDRTDRLAALFADDERPALERRGLVRLMQHLAGLPAPPDPYHLYPRYSALLDAFREALRGSDPVAVEDAFLMLYSHVHGYDVPYTAEERRRVVALGGYLCHVGGLSPILKAGPFLQRDTVSADYGAGNGLQGLLMQWLYPHRKVVQIEISSRLVAAGQALQAWLGVPPDRVEWVTGDITDVSPAGFDFIYLYRPVRPEGPGRAFYEWFAEELERGERPVVIFSVADCLRGFLSARFEVFFSDGHLTCLRGA